MYEGDSFYTLTGLGQFGLALLSLTLTAVLLWLAAKVMRRLSLVLSVVLALILFYGFVWLSPQIYYTYYMTLFEGLPWQIVVKDPPDMQKILRMLTFRDDATLSAHSQGVLGWLLIATAFITRWRAVKAAEPDDPS